MQCYKTEKGSNGDWDKKYQRAYPLVAFFAILYSLGVPLLNYVLVSKFKDMGKRGNKAVQSALGWMCKFNKFVFLISPGYFCALTLSL